MIDALYSFLKSAGFDEPLHSPITHMPIGLVVGALIFFLVAVIFKRRQLAFSARHASILALVFAFPTILLGIFDWIHYYNGILLPAIKIKMILAGFVLVLLGAGIFLGGKAKASSFWMMVIYALSFLAVAGLGYFGAGVVYGRGGSAKGGEAFQRGQDTFASNCQACHGNGGNVMDASLPIKGSKRLESLTAFKAFVRAPSRSDGSAGEMPAFPPDMIPDAGLEDLHAYVSTGNESSRR
jgi:mono/diheme cytochrome c family protein